MKERHLASVHRHIKPILWNSHMAMIPSSSGRMPSKERTKRLAGKEPLGGPDYVVRMAFARLKPVHFLTPNMTLTKIFILYEEFYSNLNSSIEAILWDSVDLDGVGACAYVYYVWMHVCVCMYPKNSWK